MAWFCRFSKLLKHSKNIVFLKKNMIKVWTLVVRCLVIKKFDNKYHLAVICQDRGDNYLPWNAPTSIWIRVEIEVVLDGGSRSYWMVGKKSLHTNRHLLIATPRDARKTAPQLSEKSLSGYLVSWWWFFEKKYVLCDGKLKPYWRNQ